MPTAKKPQPIIDAGAERSTLRKTVERTLAIIGTTLMWLVLLYFVYEQLFIENEARAVVAVDLIGVTAALVALVAGGWQLYNWLLYRGADRRRAIKPHSPAKIGALYGISADDMAIIGEERQITTIRYADGKYYFVVAGHEPIEIVSLRGHSK